MKGLEDSNIHLTMKGQKTDNEIQKKYQYVQIYKTSL